MARFKTPKAMPVRKATYLVLNLNGRGQALVEGPFKNTFDTMKEAEEYAGTVAESHGGRLHIVQLLGVVTKSRGSCTARRVADEDS